MMQFETARYMDVSSSTSSASTFESTEAPSHRGQSGSNRSRESSRRTSDFLFETQEALIRITGPVKGFANHLTSVNAQSSVGKSDRGFGESSYYQNQNYYASSQRDGGYMADLDDMSDFTPEEMSTTSKEPEDGCRLANIFKR